MKFKSFSAHILALLGLSEWSKVEDKNSITAEEVAKLKNYGFTEKFLTDFKASLENDFQDEAEDGNQGEETEEPRTTAFLRGLLGDTAARLTQAQEQLEALQTQQRDENRNNTALIAKKDAERSFPVLSPNFRPLRKMIRVKGSNTTPRRTVRENSISRMKSSWEACRVKCSHWTARITFAPKLR